MKINFSIPKIYQKVKSVFAPKDKFYTDGRVDSYKTEHEYIKFGYTENGDRFVKEYKSEPKMFFKGKHKLLLEKYLLDSKTNKNTSK